MTLHHERYAEKTGLRENLAKPPPFMTEPREAPLFQSMDQLRKRHGNLPAARNLLCFWGGGILIGSVVFGLLFLTILLLE